MYFGVSTDPLESGPTANSETDKKKGLSSYLLCCRLKRLLVDPLESGPLFL